MKNEKNRRKCWKIKSTVRGNDTSDRAFVNDKKLKKLKSYKILHFFFVLEDTRNETMTKQLYEYNVFVNGIEVNRNNRIQKAKKKNEKNMKKNGTCALD